MDNKNTYAYKLYAKANNVQFDVSIEKTSGPVHEFACTQVQKTIAGRHDILKETTLKDYKTIDPKDHKNGWNVPAMVSYDHQEAPSCVLISESVICACFVGCVCLRRPCNID